MSALPKEAVQEFKKIYLARFGVELDDAEASRRANNLVELYKVVFSDSDIKEPPTNK